MKGLLKDTAVQVNLNDQETRDLDRAVEKERRRRGDMTVGRATLLRELAMPHVRELAAADPVEAS